MKNLIDVRAVGVDCKKSPPTLNKIKVSMVCIIAILLNGVCTKALAGDMLTQDTIPGSGVNVSARSEPSSLIPSLKELIPFANPKDFIPIIKGEISSRYGSRRHPITGKLKHHSGLDVRAPRGTPIHPPANGTIVFSGWRNGYGNTIIIDHGNGYQTLIAHNHKNIAKVNDVVTKESVIGTVGTTGWATGPHMHIEVTLNGKPINPEKFFKRSD